MFKIIASDITKSGKALSIFNRDMSLFIKNWNNTQGFKNRIKSSFTNPNVITQHDLTNIKEYNKAIELGTNKQAAFYHYLSDSSIAVQNLAANAKYGTINTEGLVVVTEKLTIAQRAAAVASKAMGATLNLILNVGWIALLNFIISGITKAVNAQNELREKISQTAQEAKEETDNLNDLIKSYEEFADKVSYTAEEKERLRDIQQELTDMYHTEVDNIDLVNGKYDEQIEKLRKLQKAKLEDAEYSLIAEREQAKRESSYENLVGSGKNKSFMLSDDDFESKEDYDKIAQALKDIGIFTEDIGLIDKIWWNGRLSFVSGDAEKRLDDVKSAMKVLKEYGYTNINLYSKLNDLAEEYQDYVDNESEAVSNLAENQFQQYQIDNPYNEKAGKNAYLSWKKGLIDSAEGDTKLQHELGVLAEKQFPDYQKYFENLSKATSMFLNSVNSASEGELANQKYNFLIGLSDEDLEIATQIPDLFKNGLDGAAKEIEKFKKAHPITVDTDEAEEEIKTLADISSEASKKISLIKTAMEEMGEAGSISASTFAELSESGIDLNECLDIVNGKFVVNIEKLKDLEKQTYLDEIATDQLRLAELELVKAQTKAHGGDTSWFDDEIERLKQDITFKGALAKEIDNAKPDDSGGGDGDSEKPDLIVKFEKELAEKQHEINMGRMKEDAAYWDWYESAYKKAYDGQKDYQDDMYKHEEAVYNGRKKLAEDAFEAEKKAFESSVSKHEDNIDRAKDRGYDSDGNYLDTDSRAKYIEGEYDRIITDIQNRINALIADGAEKNKDEIESLEKDLESRQNKKSDFIYDTGKTNFDNRITDLEKQIESAEKDSTDYEGKKLDTSEKYDYIRRNYDEILAEINNRIGEIVESGVEGHEEELKELEEMYEEYTDKRESTYDDEINHEISVLEKLKDKESDRFDEQIKKLEEQKDAVEDSYDDEIKKIDEKIKAIQDENDEKERTNDLEKARQELEKAGQRTRKVYGSNGMVEYRQDDEAIAEAQKNYDNAKKDIEIAELEKQKEELENNKKTEINKYDEMINAVNQQKDSQIQYWDYLIDILEKYLNPDSLESSSELWDRILGDREKVRQEQGQTIVNGQAIDNPDGKTADPNEINENINNAIESNAETAESNANAAKANEETAKAKQQEETTSISPEEAEMKFAQTLGQFFMNGLLPFANNGMTASSQFMNEQHGEAAAAINTSNAVNNYNNSPVTNNTFTIGDIRITNPVGNSDDLVRELKLNLPNAFLSQMFTNLKN